jgi:hypothetical protein
MNEKLARINRMLNEASLGMELAVNSDEFYTFYRIHTECLDAKNRINQIETLADELMKARPYMEDTNATDR